MILTCPACTMRYIVSEGSIGPNGRRVRCANCGHQWTQEAEEGLDEELFAEPPAFLENIPEEDDPFENNETAAPPPPFDDITDEDIDFQSILRKEIEASPIPAGVHPDLEDPVLAQLVKDRQKIKVPPKGKIGGFAAAISIYLVLFAILLALHPQISRIWPPSNLLYNLVGLKPMMPGEGLALDNLRAEMADGKITMKGDINNLKDADATVPAVMATIVDDNNKMIDHLLIAPPIARIKPEGSVSFDVTYPKIPDGATNVTFAFSFIKVEPASEKPAAAPVEKVGETPRTPESDVDVVPPVTQEQPAETAKPVTPPAAPDAVMTPAEPSEPAPEQDH